jgi:hypothetical protein
MQPLFTLTDLHCEPLDAFRLWEKEVLTGRRFEQGLAAMRTSRRNFTGHATGQLME